MLLYFGANIQPCAHPPGDQSPALFFRCHWPKSTIYVGAFNLVGAQGCCYILVPIFNPAPIHCVINLLLDGQNGFHIHPLLHSTVFSMWGRRANPAFLSARSVLTFSVIVVSLCYSVLAVSLCYSVLVVSLCYSVLVVSLCYSVLVVSLCLHCWKGVLSYPLSLQW